MATRESLSRRVLLSVSSVAETWRTSHERPLCLLMTPERAPAAHCFDAGALPALGHVLIKAMSASGG